MVGESKVRWVQASKLRSTISSIVRGELPKLEACEEESIKEKNDGELFWKFGGLVFKE